MNDLDKGTRTSLLLLATTENLTLSAAIEILQGILENLKLEKKAKS